MKRRGIPIPARTNAAARVVGGAGNGLQVPTPYPLQREIILHPAKRKVICAGRRVGKTIMAAGMSIGGDAWGNYGLLDGKHILLSSTSQEQADAFWDYIAGWIWPLLEQGAYKNEVKRIIRFKDGEIKVKTGSNPDALRSRFCDLLVLDECAYLDPNAWRQAGAPTLADRDGNAVFISTPKRRNWFFELYNYATDPQNVDWHAWNFSTLENPFLTVQALERLQSDMTEDDYKQEILARFLEGQGAVFRYVDERCTAVRREPYPGRFVFGVDWAQINDSTVIRVMDVETKTEVDFDRFNGIDWALQRGRLRTLYDKWKPYIIIAESNSVGSPNIEALQREGLPIHAFETTATSKPPLIESLVLAFDRGEITALNEPIVKGELMAYERKVSATTNRSQYSAPTGLHDDCVMAMALEWYGATLPTYRPEIW